MLYEKLSKILILWFLLALMNQTLMLKLIKPTKKNAEEAATSVLVVFIFCGATLFEDEQSISKIYIVDIALVSQGINGYETKEILQSTE